MSKILSDDAMLDLGWLACKIQEGVDGFGHREEESRDCKRIYKKVTALVAEINTLYDRENEKAHKQEMALLARLEKQSWSH